MKQKEQQAASLCSVIDLLPFSADVVARMSGDEFILYLNDIGPDEANGRDRVSALGARLLAEMTRPYRMDPDDATDEGGILLSASIGATLYQPRSVAAETLLLQADIALSKAKSSGRNQLLFFDIAQQNETDTRLEMEHKLRRGCWPNSKPSGHKAC